MAHRFYMVSGVGPSRVRHDSLDSAEREAVRLARENPGIEFFVMASIRAFVKDDVRQVEILDRDADIPF